MNTQYPSRSLILLSGKKSNALSLIKRLTHFGLPFSSFISTEMLRQSFLGEQGNIIYHSPGTNSYIKDLIFTIVNMRLKEELPTLIYQEKYNPNEIQQLESIANKYSLPTYRINVDLINSQNVILYPNLINTTHIYVIGDTHGLLSDTTSLLLPLSWSICETRNCFIGPKNSQLLFLGDILDRGSQSIDLLKIIYNSELLGTARLILGNHEDKLLKSYTVYKESGILSSPSISSSETFFLFLQLPKQEQEALYNYLRTRPAHYSLFIDKKTGLAIHPNNNNLFLLNKPKNIFKIGFTHAHTNHFHPFQQMRSFSLYGNKEVNLDTADKEYSRLYLEGENSFVLFRGHTRLRDKTPHVYSLEQGQSSNGLLACTSIQKYLKLLSKQKWKPSYSFFESSSFFFPTHFSYDKFIKHKSALLQRLKILCKNQTLFLEHQQELGLRTYYHSKPPYDLDISSGITLGHGSDIVVHPLPIHKLDNTIHNSDQTLKGNIYYISPYIPLSEDKDPFIIQSTSKTKNTVLLKMIREQWSTISCLLKENNCSLVLLESNHGLTVIGLKTNSLKHKMLSYFFTTLIGKALQIPVLEQHLSFTIITHRECEDDFGLTIQLK